MILVFRRADHKALVQQMKNNAEQDQDISQQKMIISQQSHAISQQAITNKGIIIAFSIAFVIVMGILICMCSLVYSHLHRLSASLSELKRSHDMNFERRKSQSSVLVNFESDNV